MGSHGRSPRYQSLSESFLSTSSSFSWRIRGNRLINGIPISPRVSSCSSFPNRGGPWKHTPNIVFPEGESDEADETCSEADADSPVNDSQAAVYFGRGDPLDGTASVKSLEACEIVRPTGKPGELQNRSKNARGTVNCVLLEVRKQLMLAGPMIGVNLMQYLTTIISLMFLGHLGELQLASASLAMSLASVLGYDVLIGMSSVLETLCGQAFGAGQLYMVGVYLQRALVVSLIACIPLTLIFLYMEKLLLFLGQDPMIATKAGDYAVWLLPSIYAAALLQPLIKYLQTQSIVLPMLLCSATTLGVHLGLCWLIIHQLGAGYKGAAVATSISFWITVVALVLYMRFWGDCDDTWDGFSEDAFKDFKEFLKLSFSSGTMVCLEYWCFETMVLLSGLLPNPELELAAFSICLNTVTLNYMIPFGISAAVSTRVANELGAGNASYAKFAVYVALGLSVVQASVIGILLVLLRSVWGGLFSNEPRVMEHVSSLMPFLAVTTTADGIQGVLSGVARGCGWQELGAYVNLGAFYGVSLPVGVVLAFVFRLGGKGLWIGLISGLLLQTCILLYVTFTTDWNEQVAAATHRIVPQTTAYEHPPLPRPKSCEAMEPPEPPEDATKGVYRSTVPA